MRQFFALRARLEIHRSVGRDAAVKEAGEGRLCIAQVTPAASNLGMVDAAGDLFYNGEQMKRGELLGSLEYVVLLALARFEGSAHGMLVRREIAMRTGREISIGAIYGTLERLEEKGYVSSFIGESTPERGGRAKRIFRIETAGKEALRISEETLLSMTAGLKSRWGTI